MTSAVNTGQILEALNGKLDRDTLNINDTGEINMASMGMPSNTYDDLTLGASGTEYTAPANGWYLFGKSMGTNAMIGIENRSNNLKMRVLTTTNDTRAGYAYVPVLKGDKIVVEYQNTGSTVYFRFIYAQGSESEASS